jgi:excisionase family DNA binding protein
LSWGLLFFQNPENCTKHVYKTASGNGIVDREEGREGRRPEMKITQGGGMETYLTIEEVARHLKLAKQTIRRYVLNREIPYHKIKKVIRFRLSEVERWVDLGGGKNPDCPDNSREGNLFAGLETGQAGADGNDEETGETVPENGAGENEEPGRRK